MVFQLNINFISLKVNNNSSFIQFSQKSKEMSNIEYAEYVTG